MEKKIIKRNFSIEVIDKGHSRQINIKRINFGHHDLIGLLVDVTLKLILNPNIDQEKKIKHDYIG